MTNFLGSISQSITQNLQTPLLYVIDLDKIWTVNSKWEKKWEKNEKERAMGENGCGFGLDFIKKKFKKEKKTKIDYEGS